MTIPELNTTRQDLAAKLIGQIDELAATYQQMREATHQLHKELYRADRRRQNGVRVPNDPVHGLEKLPDRLMLLIGSRLFNQPGGDFDLVAVTEKEGRAAVYFAQIQEGK